MADYEVANGGANYSATVTSGSAGSKGDYTELIAATSFDAYGLIVHVVNAVDTRFFLLDIATGAEDSEVVLIPNLVLQSGQDAGNYAAHCFHAPLFVPAGTRLAARSADAIGTQGMGVSVHLVAGALGFAATYGRATDYGTGISGLTRGADVDPGGSANSKGTYVQLTASTTHPINILQLNVGNRANQAPAFYQWAVDIAIGAAMSEVVVVPDFSLQAADLGDGIFPNTFLFPVTEIPAGTRLAVRAMCSGTDATDRLINVNVIGYDDFVANSGGGTSPGGGFPASRVRTGM